MEILAKILAAVIWTAAMLSIVLVFDRKIARMTDWRWMLIARSLLFAVAFTPTAYHHAPNTIVAPLHLSTICGNLFYGYEYTAGMFVYGVMLPVACGWIVIGTVLLFRALPKLR